MKYIMINNTKFTTVQKSIFGFRNSSKSTLFEESCSLNGVSDMVFTDHVFYCDYRVLEPLYVLLDVYENVHHRGQIR